MGRIEAGAIARDFETLMAVGSAGGLTDGELIRRFARREGDGAAAERAFALLVDRHGPMVLGVCRDLLRDDLHAADDAFQATFLVLARKARSFGPGDSLGRWLFGVARKVATRARSDAWRRRSREGAPLPSDPPAPNPPDPGAALSEAELRSALRDAIARLPAPQREAVVLCHVEGLTHEQAAERLGCPVGTVRSRLARGRDRLRARLAPALSAAGLAPSVPAPLREAAARAAVAFASSLNPAAGTVPAGAAILAREILLAMTTAKLALVVAPILTLGTMAAAGAALAQQEPGVPSVRGVPAVPAAPITDPVPPIVGPGLVGDLLATPADRPDPAASPQPRANELAARLIFAARHRDLAVMRARVGQGSETERIDAIGQYDIIAGIVADQIEAARFDLGTARAEMLIRQAALRQAEAAVMRARAEVARLKAVNLDDHGRAAADAASAEAAVEMRRAEIALQEVREEQAERRIESLVQALDQGEKAEPLPPARAPIGSPAIPPPGEGAEIPSSNTEAGGPPGDQAP